MGDDKETPFQYIIMQVREIHISMYIKLLLRGKPSINHGNTIVCCVC